MIDPKELRIGNLVTVKSSIPAMNGKFGEVEFVSWHTVAVKVQAEPDYTPTLHFNKGQGLHPIPLNEEWLKKLGFQYNGFDRDTKIYINKRYAPVFYLWHDEEQGYKYKWTSDRVRHMKLLRNVHKLQNLFFAMTGLELLIDATKEEVKG